MAWSPVTKLRLIGKAVYNKQTGCLEWTAYKDKDGYGTIKLDYQTKHAHRVALELRLDRELDEGEQALHGCDNPSCISVAKGHVFLGNHRINMKMAAEHGLMRGYIASDDRRAWGTGRKRDLHKR